MLNLFIYPIDTRSCDNCKEILDELEKIDGEADKYGVEFVKNSERAAAKKHGITKFPSLVYFRHREPTVFQGDLFVSSIGSLHLTLKLLPNCLSR